MLRSRVGKGGCHRHYDKRPVGGDLFGRCQNDRGAILSEPSRVTEGSPDQPPVSQCGERIHNTYRLGLEARFGLKGFASSSYHACGGLCFEASSSSSALESLRSADADFFMDFGFAFVAMGRSSHLIEYPLSLADRQLSFVTAGTLFCPAVNPPTNPETNPAPSPAIPSSGRRSAACSSRTRSRGEPTGCDRGR